MAEATTAQPGGNGASGAEAVRDQAGELASQAQEKVQEAAGEARSRVTEELDTRTSQAGEQVGNAVSDVRSVAEELRKQGKETPARYVEQAADRGERLAGYLREADPDRMLRDVEDLGRRNPWALMAGGLALGMLGARFLKASSRERYRSAASGPTMGTNGPPVTEPSISEPPAVPLGEPPIGVGRS